MLKIINLMLVLNILNFAGFGIGKYFLNASQNLLFISRYAMLMAGLLLIYLLGNLYLSIYLLFIGKTILSLSLSVFIFLPFMYGYLSKYKTSGFYINLQILTFLLNGIFIGELALKVL